MRVLLVNGPPRSGKDTVGRLICEGSPLATGVTKLKASAVVVPLLQTRKFSAPLRRAMRDMFAWDITKVEHEKDQKKIHGRTPREIMIALSEQFFKPTFGPAFMGVELSRRLKIYAERESYGDAFGVVVTDSGFLEEIQPVLDTFPGDVRLLQMSRSGCTFEGDSRQYITPPEGCLVFKVDNNGSFEHLRSAVQDQRQWLLGAWD